MKPHSIAISLAALSLIGLGRGVPAHAETRLVETRPIVVELFTSQGCSSCPPADALLAELSDRKDVLALGFHVDYWDRLGWKDPLSAPGSTDRQNRYAKLFGKNEIYTPQIVIDGRRQVVGSNRGAVIQAIDMALPAEAASVTFAPDRRSVAIGAGQGNGSIILVGYVRSRSNPVKRGENAGHMAEDADAVETLRDLGTWNGAAVSFPVEMPQPNHGVAILVQAADGTILGAASLSG